MRLGLVAAILLMAGTGHAFVPDREPPIVAARGVQPRLARIVVPAQVGSWRAIRDRATGVVVRMWGSYVAVPGAMRDPAIAERAARAFLAAHRGELAPGSRAGDFRLVTNRVDGALRTVAFEQTASGLRVVGGQLHVVFGRDRLFVAGSGALPHVRVTVPRAAGGRAPVQRAAAWLGAQTQAAVTVRATGERVVLPIIRGTGAVEYHVAEVLDARAGAAGRWNVYVTPDGAPLLRESRVHFAEGTLQYDVADRHPAGPRTAVTAKRANITVDGVPATTGEAGGFSWPGTANATVVPGLVGTFIHVINSAGALATTSLTAAPGQPVTWSEATDEMADAQLAAFIYGTIAKERARVIHPGLAWLDQAIEIHVNEASTCNAFSTGDAIHFFRRGAQCENTARLADVVHHEFGHSFHSQSVIPGAGAMHPTISEGVADFFAGNIANDSGIGRGFDFTDAPNREIDPIGTERTYPADVVQSPHETGLIIGGTLWDLRKAMIAKHGEALGVTLTEKIFLGILQRASDLPTTFAAALTADDDDGDLGNGTPNYCTIVNAFGAHGLAGGEYRTTTLGTPVVEGLTITVPVEIPEAGACPVPQVTAMTLTVFTDGVPAELAMTAQGAVWTATLPAAPDGTVLHYNITATLDDGAQVVRPDNAADPRYQLFVGDATPIWCEGFEVDPRWTVIGATEWDVGAPVNAEAGDPTSAFAGASVLGTDVRGDGHYRANIATRIETPAIDASSYGRVHLQFRRWLTIEDAAADRASVRINGETVWTNASSQDGTLDHVDQEWRFVDVDLTAYAASPLTISWQLTSDDGRNLGGWNLDEVCVVGLDKIATCGDGILDDGEDCDDGNLVDGDDCAATCALEDAGCCSARTDPTGPLLLGLGLFGVLARRRRRVAVV